MTMGVKRDNTFGRLFMAVFKAVMWVNVVYVLWYGYEFVTGEIANPDGWCFSEMLINYQGGFVRRGLLGEIIYQLSAATGIAPQFIFVPICVCAALFVIVLLLRNMHKRGIEWWIAVTPLMFGTCYECLIRKDFIIFTLFVATLCLYRSRWHALVKLAGVSVLSLLALLIYEPAFFMYMPVLALIIWRDPRLKAPRWAKLCTYLAIFLFLCWQVTVIGGVEKAQAIQVSWHALFPDLIGASPQSSIGAIAWSIRDSLEYNNSILLAPMSVNTLWVILVIVVAVYVYVRYPYVAATKTRAHKADFVSRGTWASLIVAQMLSLTPLWLGLTCDYGRMSMYVIVTSLLIVFILPRDTVESIFPQRLTSVFGSVNDKIDRVIPNNIYTMGCILMLSGVPFARCIKGLIVEAMPVKRVISVMWKIKMAIVG